MASHELQFLLDRSAAHIRTQGRASTLKENSGLCRYLNDCGDKCAAGIFILKYDSGMEGKTWRNVVTSGFAGNLEPLSVKHSDFVASVLQLAHDNAVERDHGDFIEVYEAELRSLIGRWNRERPAMTIIYTEDAA